MSLEALSPDATTQPRGTMADSVYTQLRTAILELRLLPGVGISEAEVARHLGVSRQPVREAFGRLARTGYLRVQPQRRTEVVKISVQEVRNARFIREALEVAVVREACQRDVGELVGRLEDICGGHVLASAGRLRADHLLLAVVGADERLAAALGFSCTRCGPPPFKNVFFCPRELQESFSFLSFS